MLRDGAVEQPWLEARIITAHILNCTLEKLLLDEGREVSEGEITQAEALLQRRLSCEPIAYITGRREFYGRDFVVNRNVLIPRPDTEILVDMALQVVQKKRKCRILELGVGSGCIIVTLLAEIKDAGGLGVDISPQALEVAAINAGNIGVAQRLELKISNWFSAIEAEKFDLIISNPPYVVENEEVYPGAVFEPQIALYARKNGLECYEEIAHTMCNYLADDGVALFEIGRTRLEPVKDIFISHGFSFLGSGKDLAGIDRCAIFGHSLN